VADHGKIPGDTIHGHYDDAQQVLDRLAAIGIDYDDVVETLEREGVEKFETSWTQLLESVQEQLDRIGDGK
jgi:transaldolase